MSLLTSYNTYVHHDSRATYGLGRYAMPCLTYTYICMYVATVCRVAMPGCGGSLMGLEALRVIVHNWADHGIASHALL